MTAPGVETREIILDGQRIPYTLRRSARKTLGLRIDPRGLTVGVPLRVGVREAESFIRSHAAWVVEKLRSLPARQAETVFAVEEGALLPLLGEHWRLRLAHGNNRAQWHRFGKELVLELALRQADDGRQVLRRALQRHALELFHNRVAEFCLRLGQEPPPVALSNARTRWGSCSRRSGIRLHWRLIHLPLELIDYVVAHEVAHLLEMNHSPRFWSVVERLYPNHLAARKALRAAASDLPTL